MAGGRQPAGAARTRRAGRHRQRIIAEAARLYGQGGSAAMSYGALAEGTRLGKATLFHYFANKDALVLAVFESLGARLEAAGHDWFAPRPHSYAARLGNIVSGFVDFYGEDPDNARILCHGLLETDRVMAADSATSQLFGRFVAEFSRFIAGGIRAGEFYRERPEAVVMTIGGVVLFECMLPARGREFMQSGRRSSESRKSEILRAVERAVVREKGQ